MTKIVLFITKQFFLMGKQNVSLVPGEGYFPHTARCNATSIEVFVSLNQRFTRFYVQSCIYRTKMILLRHA